MDHADDVVRVAARHRQARVLGRQKRLADVRLVLVEVQPVDLRARRQQAPHRAVAEPEHARDHAALVRLDDAGRFRLRHDGADLLVGHDVRGRVVLPEQAEHGTGRGIEQPHDRQSGAREEAHGGRGHAGDGLRVAQRQLLRHELPHHDRQVGDDADDDPEPDRIGDGLTHAVLLQDLAQPCAERRAREGSSQDADQRDADLGRREEPARLLGEREGGGRPGAAVLDHGSQPRAPGGHDGEFGEGEHPVEGDEADRDDQFEHGVTTGAGKAPAYAPYPLRPGTEMPERSIHDAGQSGHRGCRTSRRPGQTE